MGNDDVDDIDSDGHDDGPGGFVKAGKSEVGYPLSTVIVGLVTETGVLPSVEKFCILGTQARLPDIVAAATEVVPGGNTAVTVSSGKAPME